MPPRAEDIAIEEAVAPSDAAADGAQFFASVKQEGQDQQPAEEVPSDDSKSKKVKKKIDTARSSGSGLSRSCMYDKV